MNLYRVSWSQTEYRSALIDADTEEEAVAKAREGDYDNSEFDMAEGFDLTDVELIQRTIRIVVEISENHAEEARQFYNELLAVIDDYIDNTDCEVVENRYRVEEIVGKGLNP